MKFSTLLKIFIFFAIQIIGIGGYWYIKTLGLRNFENEIKPQGMEASTSTGTIPKNDTIPLIFFGSSRAAAMSKSLSIRYLGSPVINLARGGGGGLLPAFVLWEQTIAHHSKVDHVIYFLDPFVLFSRSRNEMHPSIKGEPLTFGILRSLILHGYDLNYILEYVRKPKNYGWVPIEGPLKVSSIGSPTTEEVSKRMSELYGGSLDEDTFRIYAGKLETFIDSVVSQNTRLSLVFAPTLMGYEKGFDLLKKKLESGNFNSNLVSCYDFVNSIRNANFFTDVDHLNSAGVGYFFQKLLKPSLDSKNLGSCKNIQPITTF